jgi:hypothetical protein
LMSTRKHSFQFQQAAWRRREMEQALSTERGKCAPFC